MKGRKTWERGYAAGLIDGEGCIQIKKIKNLNHKRNPEYSLQISMNMVDTEAIDFMKGVFGGSVYGPLKTYGKGFRPNYRWEITRKSALTFLKQILPFLRVKRVQAELGIRFQFNRITQDHKHGKYQPFSKETIDRYDWYYREMRRLKKIHLSCADATTERIDSETGSDSLNLQEQKL